MSDTPTLSANIGLLVRHALTATGVYLVTRGAKESYVNGAVAELTPIISGAAITGAGLLWSWIEKYFNKQTWSTLVSIIKGIATDGTQPNPLLVAKLPSDTQAAIVADPKV